MPMEASRVSDFTIRGKREALGPPDRAPAGGTPRSRHRDPVVGEQLLGEGLVAREEQARASCSPCRAASAARGRPTTFWSQVATSSKPSSEVEGDVGLELLDGVADRAELAAHAERAHLVAQVAEGRGRRRTRSSTRRATASSRSALARGARGSRGRARGRGSSCRSSQRHPVAAAVAGSSWSAP